MDEPECAQYVRQHYSADGIDIIGYDASSVTCLMPCDFDDLTDFLSDVKERFGYEADFAFAKKTGQAMLTFMKQGNEHKTHKNHWLEWMIVASSMALATVGALVGHGAWNHVNTTGVV